MNMKKLWRNDINIIKLVFSNSYEVLVVQLCPTLWPHRLLAIQAPLSKEFFRQEHWSEWPYPSPGDLPNSGIKPGSSALQADSSPSEPPGKPMAFIYNLVVSSRCQWLQVFLYVKFVGGIQIRSSQAVSCRHADRVSGKKQPPPSYFKTFACS